MIPELETADFEAILAPFAGDQPTGVDLRQDFAPTSIYFRLRDARAQARDAERQADTQGGDEGLPVLWRPVATMPEDGDLEIRVAAVAGLSGQGADGTLMQPLRKVALFRRPDGSPFSLWQYQAAVELSGITDPARRAQRIDSGVLPFEEVEKEARLAGAAHWSAQRELIDKTLASWKEMERAFDEKAGQASPAGNRVRDLLEFVSETCRRFAPPEATDGAAEMTSATAGDGSAAAATPGSITGREQALHQVTEIAAWFKRNEPSSPIGFTLDEAVRRARLGWPELVAELVADETARHTLLTTAGIKPPSTEPQQ
jgi:type VI secretion system protein ImpA